ncbi:MAG: hypothetical protein KKE86_04105 [Planctomycetes bacterium]|nr:hypothetical protein [Planctomycetota bacterium]MBU4398501.1 hypothetical protein [Planctomycetota bacterium]MCG2684380.1 hypothetical protein [Planctomycetales bacterium]
MSTESVTGTKLGVGDGRLDVQAAAEGLDSSDAAFPAAGLGTEAIVVGAGTVESWESFFTNPTSNRITTATPPLPATQTQGGGADRFLPRGAGRTGESGARIFVGNGAGVGVGFGAGAGDLAAGR